MQAKLFTYRCWESEDSCDAELWHHTRQRVRVLHKISSSQVDEADVGKMYRVRFQDGFEYDVFEGELQ